MGKYEIRLKRGDPYTKISEALGINRGYLGKCLKFDRFNFTARLARHMAMNNYNGIIIQKLES